MDEALRDAFIREVADAVRHWEDWASRQLASSTDTPAAIAAQAIRGVAHSVLVSIDGGTAISDQGRRIWLTDAVGESVGEGLHEYLFDHLPDAP